MADEARISSLEQQSALAETTNARVSAIEHHTAVAEDGNARVSAIELHVAHELTEVDARVSTLEQQAAVAETTRARVSALEVHAAVEIVLPPVFETPQPIAAPTSFGGKPLVAVFEIDLDSGTERFAAVPIRTKDIGFIPAGIRSVGSFLRELPQSRGVFSISELQIELDNTENQWAKRRADEGFIGRRCRVKLGDPDDNYSTWYTAFEGVVDPQNAGWLLRPESAEFKVVDVWARFLTYKLFIPLQYANNFAVLEGENPNGDFPPILYGIYDSNGLDRRGAVPAYQLDPQFGPAFRYVACQGDIEGIQSVFNFGVLVDPSEYTITSEPLQGGAGGNTINYIDFNQDPKQGLPIGGIPANADETIPEVTFDIRGAVTTPGTFVVTNPATQLKLILQKYGQATASPADPALQPLNDLTPFLDLASITAVETELNNLGITGSVWLKSHTTQEELLQRFSESFGINVVSGPTGLMKFVLSQKRVTGGTKQWLLRNAHVIDDQMEIQGPDTVVSVLTTRWIYDLVGDDWIEEDADQSTDTDTVNNGAGAELNLWYVRDGQSKGVTIEEFLFAAEEGRSYVLIGADPHLIDDLEVGDEIALSHLIGPASDGLGWRQRFFRIIAIGPEFDSSLLQLRLQELADHTIT